MAIAFGVWGVMPLYWHLLAVVPAEEILIHRMFWSFAVLAAIVLFRGNFTPVLSALKSRAIGGPLVLSSLLISTNWGLYIWAVNHGRVLDAALGYFINPLMNVALGVVVLGERMRPAPWVAVVIASAGVVVQAAKVGHVPWIALALALSFGCYGLVRKIVAVDSLVGFSVETAYMVVPAGIALAWYSWSGHGIFLNAASPDHRLSLDALLILTGAATAYPLIEFSKGLRVVPMATVGLMQFIAPILQFACGVLVLDAPFALSDAAGTCSYGQHSFCSLPTC
ncbi:MULTISPECIES: EamA family transporter RarD [Lysobacteraceae]|uniref:EamA family transporter RarD n=1 Tax=Lysobacteraceae TaxID=32033 RepID=UPI001BD16B4B|nr:MULTISPECIES: EamA family transporter RarD [Lysobacter]